MNIPKEAIERAIAGGWLKANCNVQQTRSWCKYLYPEDMALIALDPTFWQALGKALGWGESTFHQIANGIEYQEYGYDEVWRLLAHRFYDLILQGKPTEDFWKELLV